MEDYNYPNQFEEKDKSIIAITAISVIFHVFILVILPLLISLFSKPQVFEQPQTFELVSLPSPVRPTEPVEDLTEPVAEERPAEPDPEPEPEPVVEPIPEPEPIVTPDPEPVVEPIPDPEPVVEREREPEPDPEPVNVDDIFASTSSAPVQTSTITTVNPFNGDWYLSTLKSSIEKNWLPTIKDSTLSVQLSFTIRKSGPQTILTGLSISKSSGKAILDTQAKRAIELAFPLGEFPPSYTESSLEMLYTLVPTRR